MLAQNFKTPSSLGITDIEFDALHKVLGMLERNEIPGAPGSDLRLCTPSNRPTGRPEPRYFNMCFITSEHNCGTAGCILGWAQEIAGRRLFEDGRTDDLNELFQIGRITVKSKPTIGIENITPQQAALALRSYLTHGEARWAEATA